MFSLGWNSAGVNCLYWYVNCQLSSLIRLRDTFPFNLLKITWYLNDADQLKLRDKLCLTVKRPYSAMLMKCHEDGGSQQWRLLKVHLYLHCRCLFSMGGKLRAGYMGGRISPCMRYISRIYHVLFIWKNVCRDVFRPVPAKRDPGKSGTIFII